MTEESFLLRGEHIPLIGLLKIIGLAATGGHASIRVEEGEVGVNDEVEYRKRRKLIKGDIITCDGRTIIIK